MHDRIALAPPAVRSIQSAMRPICVLVFLCWLFFCSTAGGNEATHAANDRLLDIGLVIFDPGIPAQATGLHTLGVFPEIRKSEAKYMPVVLREVLVDSAQWGVVRVLPETLDSSELLVRGKILHSDGQRLDLQIVANDATGALWLDKVYAARTAPGDYPVAPGADPYMTLYRSIADDLLQVRRQKTSALLATIREVARLRYAIGLAPAVFGPYVALSPEGIYQILRLPAIDDPMLERIMRIRSQEYLFIDTVDEQYVQLNEEMLPTYNLWRQFGAEQALFKRQFEQRISDRASAGRPGSFAALEQTYNAYRMSKIHEQDLDELAIGFNNEVTPTVMQISGTVVKLNGTLDAQYAEWRNVLQKIFALETGIGSDS